MLKRLMGNWELKDPIDALFFLIFILPNKPRECYLLTTNGCFFNGQGCALISPLSRQVRDNPILLLQFAKKKVDESQALHYYERSN